MADFLGGAATAMGIIVALVGLPAQIIKNYKNKSTKGLSLSFWLLAYINCWFWLSYGSVKDIPDWFIIIANIPFLLFASIILFQFFLYRKHPPGEF
jgi:uncharacterized protein with PQ loop repeat